MERSSAGVETFQVTPQEKSYAIQSNALAAEAHLATGTVIVANHTESPLSARRVATSLPHINRTPTTTAQNHPNIHTY